MKRSCMLFLTSTPYQESLWTMDEKSYCNPNYDKQNYPLNRLILIFRHSCNQCEYSGPSEAALRLHIQVFYLFFDRNIIVPN